MNSRFRFIFLSVCLFFVVFLTACDTAFQDNPHGATFISQITPTAKGPLVPPEKSVVLPHLAPAGFGSTLQNLTAQYGAPTTYSAPPLYAFQDGPDKWPQGSLIIVTMKENRAVEFSYVPGSNHPMTFQEAQDFAVKLLPDDAQGPTIIQQEDDHAGKCLAKSYQSPLLKTIFPTDDFISADNKDNKPGTVTINFYPDLGPADNEAAPGQDGFGNNIFLDHNQVSSVLINLGTRPS